MKNIPSFLLCWSSHLYQFTVHQPQSTVHHCQFLVYGDTWCSLQCSYHLMMCVRIYINYFLTRYLHCIILSFIWNCSSCQNCIDWEKCYYTVTDQIIYLFLVPLSDVTGWALGNKWLIQFTSCWQKISKEPTKG